MTLKLKDYRGTKEYNEIVSICRQKGFTPNDEMEMTEILERTQNAKLTTREIVNKIARDLDNKRRTNK